MRLTPGEINRLIEKRNKRLTGSQGRLTFRTMAEYEEYQRQKAMQDD